MQCCDQQLRHLARDRPRAMSRFVRGRRSHPLDGSDQPIAFGRTRVHAASFPSNLPQWVTTGRHHGNRFCLAEARLRDRRQSICGCWSAAACSTRACNTSAARKRRLALGIQMRPPGSNVTALRASEAPYRSLKPDWNRGRWEAIRSIFTPELAALAGRTVEFTQIVGRANQGKMRKRLREVTEKATVLRIILFREKSNVVTDFE